MCALLLSPVVQKASEEDVQKLKQRFMSTYDVTADGKLQIQEVWDQRTHTAYRGQTTRLHQ